MGWRFIDTDIGNPYFVTAADEAIYQARKEKIVENTLHFYRRDPSAISVGRSRKIHDDINIDECLDHNIKIVRRITGGGTIFTDKQCLIYSLVFDRGTVKLYSSRETFKNICHLIVTVLEKLGINTIYKPPNDILLNGKKISGSAQAQKENIVLIHGTILIDTDLELMKRVLKKSNNFNVSTIRNEIGFLLSLDTIKEELKKNFETFFDFNFKKSTFSNCEKHLIDKLLKERYLNDAWNFIR
jgi:lipoate-protein ligase A